MWCILKKRSIINRFVLSRCRKRWKLFLTILLVISFGYVASGPSCPARSWLSITESFYTSQKNWCAAVDEANPLLQQEGLPKFKEIQAKHVGPAFEHMISEFENGLERIEKGLDAPDTKISWATIFDPLERLSHPLKYSWGVVNHLNGVKNHPALRDAHQEVQSSIVKLASRLAQSEKIYGAMKKLNKSRNDLDREQQRILDSSLMGARHGGVELDGAQQLRFNEVLLELAKLGTTFNNNVLDATKAFSLTLTDEKDVEGLPDSLKQLMAANAADDPMKCDPAKGPWKVTLDLPCMGPFMKYSRSPVLREQVLKAYISRASSDPYDNSGVVEDMRRLRNEQAKILGYKDYVALSLESKMARNASKVWEMIHNLRDASKSSAQRELKQLQDFASSNGHKGKLMNWDVSFWSERQREHLFNYNEEDLREYFPFPVVLEGLFNMTSFLFGVRIQPAKGEADVWCDDVRFFKIFDDTEHHIASFYLDPYTRPSEKRGGAWMDSSLGKSDLMGTKPVAYLVCNQTPPQNNKPSLMTFREVQTLFHEFGHGLQHMLTTVKYAGAAGIANVEWDAVELPSQFMENWLYDSDTMKQISRHYVDDVSMPDDLFGKVVAAKKYMAGSAMLRQLYFSALDIEFHTSTDPWMDVMTRIADEYTLPDLRPLKEDRFPCAFMHLFGGGYAAGYYSYKWAEVLAADSFAAFEEAGLQNRISIAELGKRFRSTVLALGGGTDPSEVFRKFRGRDPSPEYLLKSYGLI